MIYKEYQLRKELKFLISYEKYNRLRSKLEEMFYKDENCEHGDYTVTTMYFSNTNLNQKSKSSSFLSRKMFRIRFYNSNTSVFKLESKTSYSDYIGKISEIISKEEVNNIISGRKMRTYDSELKRLINYNVLSKVLEPRFFVEFEREAYINESGNVRINFDKDIRVAKMSSKPFEEEKYVSLQEHDHIMLEVKYKDKLPIEVLQLLNIEELDQLSVNKFLYCFNKLRIRQLFTI